MKEKINFQNVSSRLSQKEMKNVLGGSGISWGMCTVLCNATLSYFARPYGDCHQMARELCPANSTYQCRGCDD